MGSCVIGALTRVVAERGFRFTDGGRVSLSAEAPRAMHGAPALWRQSVVEQSRPVPPVREGRHGR